VEPAAEVVRLLVRAGAPIDLDAAILLDDPSWLQGATDRGSTPALTRAARAGAIQVLSALLQAGADVNTRGRFGRTALIEACCQADEQQCTALVEVLIRAGADQNPVDNRGFRALDYAVALGHDPVQLRLRRVFI
jgi:ankyrin repeat protein